MTTEIRRYEPSLLSAVAELQTRLWSPDRALNERHFHWKHEQNPWFGKPEAWLAMHDGRAVAMRSFFGSAWEAGADGVQTLLPIATDAVVAEGHESTGVMREIMAAALADLAARGFPCVLNLNASPVTLVSSIAAGWRATPPLGSCHLPAPAPTRGRLRERLRRAPLLWRLAGAALLDDADERRPFRALDGSDPALLRRLGAALSVTREPRVQDMAALVGRLGRDGRLRQVRDARWLAWRYANPLATYRFVWYDAGRLEGYVALETSVSRHADRRRVTVMDVEASDTQVAGQLLEALLLLLGGQPVLAWRHALPAVVADLLEGAGFAACALPGALARQRPCLLVRPLAGDGVPWQPAGLDPAALASWDLRRVYGD